MLKGEKCRYKSTIIGFIMNNNNNKKPVVHKITLDSKTCRYVPIAIVDGELAIERKYRYAVFTDKL